MSATEHADDPGEVFTVTATTLHEKDYTLAEITELLGLEPGELDRAQVLTGLRDLDDESTIVQDVLSSGTSWGTVLDAEETTR